MVSTVLDICEECGAEFEACDEAPVGSGFESSLQDDGRMERVLCLECVESMTTVICDSCKGDGVVIRYRDGGPVAVRCGKCGGTAEVLLDKEKS